jgi:cathepsin A (carboxypeptidase C)
MIRIVLSLCLAVGSLGKTLYRYKDAPVEGGLCDASVKSLSGYVNVEDGVHEKNYFFWFFESRSVPSTDPVIIWLTGGPGCSSQLALMSENGPCTPTPDGMDTVNNPYSWNTNANIMWIDQPAGVGYSYGFEGDHNETMVAEDLYHFLQGFFTQHPEYLTNPFFVFGESYGGHYVPAVSHRIYLGNQNNDGIKINLQGLGIGNGLTDPVIQYQYYPAMAMNNSYGIKCVSEETYESMVERLPRCINLAKACQVNVSLCDQADTYCNLVETTPYSMTGLNPYDIRKPCGDNDLCYDFSNVDVFLNLQSTRDALHVSSEVKEWVSCNTRVNLHFIFDWMRNFQQYLIPMLENDIRVLIYAGDVDFICNWIGNKAWTQELRWSGKNAFNTIGDHEWKYGSSGTIGGMARSATATHGKGSLTFLQVYEAGHMVPMDQPEAALHLLNTFTSNQAFY